MPGGPGRASAAGPRRSRPGPPPDRLLSRHHGGQLIDVQLHEPVGLDELAQDLRAGGRFTVRDHPTGGDCTYQVLAEVLALALAAVLPTGAASAALNPAAVLTGLYQGGAPPAGAR
ncbi:hypothetical protein [Streptomyces sp. LaBMicrA B280]|uniref:hypothetical protein n=1 Tax=Streptomyces sp. LaBMicrA B280 TaxID=3391001 RepID=UPI003BA68DEB